MSEQPIDARDATGETVGTKLRDAAVDPRPSDYLPPINAGKADPHGPLVVAPGIHGAPPSPIVPGVVTEAREIQAATGVLVEGRSVGDVVKELSGDDRGPLGLSDESSGDFSDDGVAPSEGAVTPAKKAAKKTASRKP